MDGFCSFKGCAALLRRGAKRWRDFSLGVCRIYRKRLQDSAQEPVGFTAKR
jgi:hypothetical protein